MTSILKGEGGIPQFCVFLVNKFGTKGEKGAKKLRTSYVCRPKRKKVEWMNGRF